MKKIVFFGCLLFISFLVTCRPALSERYTVGVVEFHIPVNVKIVKGNGTDSHLSYWINKHNDTFHIEYGEPNIIDNLFNPPPVVYNKKSIELIKKSLGGMPAPDEALFSDTPKEDMQQNVFDQNYYRYDTISGIALKIIQPKVIGKGMTGIYIYELKNKYALSIYAMDLDHKSNEEALSIFRTIKYK